MTFREYQAQTNQTNEYPKDLMLFCLAMGLGSEVGELQGCIKKFYRGDAMDSGLKLLLMAEMGDCLWYLSELANHLGISLSEIAQHNLEKLQDRSRRNVIKGNGDER